MSYILISNNVANTTTAVGSPGSGFTDVNGNVWQQSSSEFKATNQTTNLATGNMVRTSSGEIFSDGKIQVYHANSLGSPVIPIVRYTSTSGGNYFGFYLQSDGTIAFIHVINGTATNALSGQTVVTGPSIPSAPFIMQLEAVGTLFTATVMSTDGYGANATPTTVYSKSTYTDAAMPSSGNWGLNGFSTQNGILQISGYAVGVTQDNVLAMGDSITYGLDATDPSTTSATNIATNVYADYAPGRTLYFPNFGSSGTKSSDWLPGGTLYNTMTGDGASGTYPTVNIMLGTNDSQDGTATSPSTYQSNMQSIVTGLIGLGYTKILLNHVMSGVYGEQAQLLAGGGASYGSNTALGLIVSYNAALDAIAAGSGGSVVVVGDTNAYNTFNYRQRNALQGGSSLTSSDGLHPQQPGYNVLGALWSANIAKALGYGSGVASGTATVSSVTATTFTLSAPAMTGSGSPTYAWWISTTSLVGQVGVQSGGGSVSTSLTFNATGYSPNTTYHAVLQSRDSAGSEVISNEVVFTTNSLGTVATPVISPAAGTYPVTQTVSITCSTGSSTIRYTLDGSAPTESNGTIYTVPFSVSSSQTVKAIGYLSGYTDSAVASSSYVIGSAPAAISAVPITLGNEKAVTGTFTISSGTSVTVNSGLTGIRYAEASPAGTSGSQLQVSVSGTTLTITGTNGLTGRFTVFGT